MTAAARSALVVTVVHHPEDARIRHRQIPALLEHGWQVTYAAPFTGYGLPLVSSRHGLCAVDLPRAEGRRRHQAFRAARRVLAEQGRAHDVVVLHDPELLLAAAGLGLPNLVWDVHEDTAAAVRAKTWLPRPLRALTRGGVHLLEQLAERRLPLLLAEYAYQERFRRQHPVVPNTVRVPAEATAPGVERVVYLGTVTMARGAAVLVQAARSLRQQTGGACRIEVIGPARDAESTSLLSSAHTDGDLVWHGFVDSDRALSMLAGALAGLSLLRDLPNYRHSMPTKVVEYMALGLPVITTPLPLPAAQVTDADCGIVVPFDDPDAVVAAISTLRQDPQRARSMGARGHDVASRRYDWAAQAGPFVDRLEEIARRAARGQRRPSPT